METLEQIKTRAEAALPGLHLAIIPNGNSANPASFLVDHDHATLFAQFLKSDSMLQMDYVSNVTGVDWPDVVEKEKVRVKREFRGQEIEVDEIVEKIKPGCLEVVYHLYSMVLKQGPIILRLRTGNRTDQTSIPSLTPIYRGAEFQEREVFDLFGVRFINHPDLRRILMWDEFEDYPMRKDYQEPDDYEYEPTPHNEVLVKARRYYPKEASHG